MTSEVFQNGRDTSRPYIIAKKVSFLGRAVALPYKSLAVGTSKGMSAVEIRTIFEFQPFSIH